MMVMKLIRVETTWECDLRQTTDTVTLSNRTLQVRYNLHYVNMCLHIPIHMLSLFTEVQNAIYSRLYF